MCVCAGIFAAKCSFAVNDNLKIMTCDYYRLCISAASEEKMIGPTDIRWINDKIEKKIELL